MSARLVLIAALAAAVPALAAAAAPIDLQVSNLQTPAGTLGALKAGRTYSATTFPIALRVAPPDGSWGGTQWSTSSYGKRVFGWAAFGRAPFLSPRGAIMIVTAYGATPSVAATLARLRFGGSHDPSSHEGGTSWGAPRPVAVAGYRGMQFDGTTWGRFGHAFIPFSARTNGAGPPDSIYVEQGEAFRLVVLDVKGKRVVLFIDSAELPADRFPAFLEDAGRLLKTLRFTAG